MSPGSTLLFQITFYSVCVVEMVFMLLRLLVQLLLLLLDHDYCHLTKGQVCSLGQAHFWYFFAPN